MTARLDRFRPHFQRRGDTTLLLLAVGLALIGLLLISSASVVISYDQFNSSSYYWTRQAIFLIFSLLAMAVVAQIDYRAWRTGALTLIIITLGLLVAVLIPSIGVSLGGAHRWLGFSPFLLQPSEMAKLAVIIYFAAWLDSRRRSDFNQPAKNGLLPLLLMTIVLISLLMKQPDMGTMMIIVLIAGSIWLVAGAKWMHLLAVILIGSLLFFILIRSSSYRWQRFTTFLNPSADPLNAGYQISQAQLAIGNGGLWGLGFGQSRQKYLYLPEPHTDAVFAVITEELGFLRVAVILAVLVVLIWRVYRIALRVDDRFGKLVAVGFGSWIGFQATLNIAAITGLMPLTGIPLPFLSYGGSSLLFLFIGLGVVYNISKGVELK